MSEQLATLATFSVNYTRLAFFAVLLSGCAAGAREGVLRIYPGQAIYGQPSQISVMAMFKEPRSDDLPSERDLGCRSPADDSRRMQAVLAIDARRKWVTAGTLSLSFPDGRILRVDPPLPNPVYGTGLLPTRWLPGQELRARFTGREFPPIDAAIALPGPVVMTEPVCHAPRPPPCATYDVQAPCSREFAPMTPRCAPLDRTRDLIVSWVPHASGVVDVRFENDESRNGLANHCQFDARAGRGIVPRAFIPPRGDVEIALGLRAFVDVHASDGSVLHVVVDAWATEARVFPER